MKVRRTTHYSTAEFTNLAFALLVQRCKRPLNPTITLPKPMPGDHPKFYLAEKHPLPEKVQACSTVYEYEARLR